LSSSFHGVILKIQEKRAPNLTHWQTQTAKASTGHGDNSAGNASVAERRAAIALFARATLSELQKGLEAPGANGYAAIREPETGLVMVRGRIGGDGAPFNLGEAAVTRAAVRIPSGETGFSYLLGRDHDKARLAALCDALWQNARTRGFIEAHVLGPVGARLSAERDATRGRTEATRVGFTTLVRGEDAA
jgi:alpha-D-ribose 1-methylphosphonate 5-triphosphate synthase subunit PhnG